MMITPRWRKVLRDLWSQKARTVLVVLSIAIGVFAVGMIAGTRVILSDALTDSWLSVRPASGTLYTAEFDEELLWTIRRMPEVAEADARRSFGVRFHAGPPGPPSEEDDVEWRSLSLFTVPHMEDIRIFRLTPESGSWPPPEREIVIERASLAWMGVGVGDTITVEAPNGKIRKLRVAGTAHDLTQTSASWIGQASGYINRETLEWLGQSFTFDELTFVAAENAMDEEHVRIVADTVRDKVERSGRTVYFTWVDEPGKHPAEGQIAPILMILGVLGLLALILSGFMVINTMQALLAQQTRQIGIMKAVGARRPQIFAMYVGMVGLFSALALAVGIPLGALGAFGMSNFMATLVNFDITSWGIPLAVLALEIAVGLLVPLLAALYPIWSAVRVTPREAMTDVGVTDGGGQQSLIDRVLQSIRGMSRPLLLSLRNTFRRKGRLALTLTTLTLAGSIFVAVFSVRDSLLLTLDGMYDYISYDALISFRKAHRTDELETIALHTPGVVAAESWRFNTARLIRDDGTESNSFSITASRPESELVHPTIEKGRWLLPEDDQAIVVNTLLLKDEPDINVGDDIVLKIEGEEFSWRVVGIVSGTPPQASAYVNLPHFSEAIGGFGRAGVVFVVTETHDAAEQARIAKALEERYEEAGLSVSRTQTSATERGQIASQFRVLVVFLLIMAVLLAVVGAIGLAGTMSLNVLERRREIGVMRAIGASTRTLFRIVTAEGVMIGLISWAVGVLLAMPLSRVLSNAVGVSILEAELIYTFSLFGAVLWLALVLLLATFASLLPARSATKVSVRAALAYE
jgi:putative ABC transport system permease protein